ncbi:MULTISPECIES: hypothetical protein [Stenotrophomonas]|uniref:hypothetical protein n=1 Tax=Stenotrophomonas TaxID=40323 RepID=UPI001FD23488|nr:MULTISPECIES: hypothetical protein [Stenotrophomonas]
MTTNPAAGIKQVKEKGDHRMPAVDVFRRVQAYAKQCSARGPRAKGAVPPYLWAAMELAYQARLRGIEVLTLTDAHVDGEVLRTNRRKGSRDNLVRKGAETEEAIAIRSVNNGTTSTIDFLFDKVRFVSPGNGRRMEYSDGHFTGYDENNVRRIRLGTWSS